jgi:hypothetical protein
MNIFHHGMDIDTSCPICWRLNEDGGYCFLICKFVKKYWRALNLEELRLALIDLNFAKQVATKILSLEEDKKSLVIGFLWLWWDTRSKANAGDKIMSTEKMVHKVHSMIDTLHMRERPNNKRKNRISCWVPQTANVLKINIDRAFIQAEKKGAWDFIVRDHKGAIVCAGRINVVHDALSVESTLILLPCM